MVAWYWLILAAIVGAVTLGVTIYIRVGDIPIIGGMIQYRIDLALGLRKPKKQSHLKYGKNSHREK